MRPFYSRRVGLVRDTLTDFYDPVSVQWAGRVMSKSENGLEWGVFNGQSSMGLGANVPRANFTAAALEKPIAKHSSIALIGVNRENYDMNDVISNDADFNRVLGFDYNFSSMDSRWNSKFSYHRSFSPGDDKDAFGHGFSTSYQGERLAFNWAHYWLGDSFETQGGYTPFAGYYAIEPSIQYQFYPKKGKVAQVDLGFQSLIGWVGGLGKILQESSIFANMRTKKNQFARISVDHFFTIAFGDFDPSRQGKVLIPEGDVFDYYRISGQFRSNRMPNFSYNLNFNAGQYLSGTQYGVNGALNWKPNPNIFLGSAFAYIYTDLDNSFSMWLLGPSLNFMLTPDLILNAIIQRNSQFNHTSTQINLKWNVAPGTTFDFAYIDRKYDQFSHLESRIVQARLAYWMNW